MGRPIRRGLRPRLEFLDDRCLLSTFAPTQVVHAYGLDQIQFPTLSGSVKGNGAGQTIAIVVANHDPYLAQDLATFDQQYGLPNTTPIQVYQPGTTSDDGWAGEETLDVEYAHAFAPAARIVVVEAASADLGAMIRAIDTARYYPGVSVVSMSWGTNEFVSQRSLDYHFTTPPGHTGVTFLAASGDSSAFAGVEWPSTSTNVVAVGGTRLRISASGSYVSEAGWVDTSGGFSSFVPEPSYQSSVQRSGSRTVPDVSAVADPNTGVLVVTTTPSDGQQSWWVVGGTSVATPIWAGIIAVADQGRNLAGLGTLDSRSQTLPAIYALPSSDFHDVTAGYNGYSTRAGYDLVTGRGTPNGPALERDLAAWGSSSSTLSGTRAKVARKNLLPARRIRTSDMATQMLATVPATSSDTPTLAIATTADLGGVDSSSPARPARNAVTVSQPVPEGPSWGTRPGLALTSPSSARMLV
jgi:subtilase family serine protease